MKYALVLHCGMCIDHYEQKNLGISFKKQNTHTVLLRQPINAETHYVLITVTSLYSSVYWTGESNTKSLVLRYDHLFCGGYICKNNNVGVV